MGWFFKLFGQDQSKITEDDLRATVARELPDDPHLVHFLTTSVIKPFSEIAGEAFDLTHPVNVVEDILDAPRAFHDRIDRALFHTLIELWRTPGSSIAGSYPTTRDLNLATILCVTERSLVLLQWLRGSDPRSGSLVWGVPRTGVEQAGKSAMPHALTAFHLTFVDDSSILLGSKAQPRVAKLLDLLDPGSDPGQGQTEPGH